MLSKEQILNEIKRTAKENGGKALGANKFENETGIKPYDWEKFWAKFGDALQEAGFMPNEFQNAYSDEFLVEKTVNLMRRLGRYPTDREFKLERNKDNEFPSKSVFRRVGSKQQVARKIFEYCKDKKGYDDILELCKPLLEKVNEPESFNDDDTNERLGEVYLFKHGKYYKIGKTNDTVRRGTELRIQLPEDLDLIHSIKTDDPSGIEAYWHKRFETKRMNGEWFNLNSNDIKVFKRWKRIF